jgi:hypothetical protein
VKGGLVFALLQFLLHSKDTFPLPAGVIGLCPFLDFTGSFPSAKLDRGLDWVPCVWTKPFTPKPSPAFPPTRPLFGLYTEMPLHPLVRALQIERKV